MSSFVFYRFRSQKEPSRVSFDGTGISVWDLKKEIIMENKMGKGIDFDFAIYNADTEEEYTEDHYIVPRSTSVLARRLPPSRPGRGNAQNYMPSAEGGAAPAGRPGYQGGGSGGGGSGGAGSRGGGAGGWTAGSFSKRFDGREDPKPASQEPVQVVLPGSAPQDEASALAAMFAASSQQWQQTQEQMAAATPVYRAPLQRPARPAAPPCDPSNPSAPLPAGGAPSHSSGAPPFRPAPDSHKPPPLGYICYRCGQKGHWIQECPTNSDRAYDDRPRIKRTTGIPKSFLTTVEGPGGTATDAQPGASGVMVTAEGGFVVARPDNASWLAHRALTKNLSATDIQNLAPTDPDLTCPVCSKLLRDATLTPCCSTSFCEDCVTNALIDNDMLCPECETRVKSVEKLKPDEGRRERVKKYIEEMVELSKEKEEEKEVKKEGEAEGDATATDEKPVVKEAEELSPVVKEEEPKAATPAPQASLSPVANRSTSLAPTDTSAQTTRAASATSNPPPAPTSTTPTPVAPINAAQQAQILRQQQLRAQQAQAMAAMQQQQQQMGMGGMGMPTPQMVQQQMYQLQMTLQNPQLPPPMRMQLVQQVQQLQMMAVQMGLMPGPGGAFNRQQQQQGGVSPFGGAGARGPNGGQASPLPRPGGAVPKANGGAASPQGAGVGAAGAKRAMPEEFGANGQQQKK